MIITKTFKKNAIYAQKYDEQVMKRQGYKIIAREEGGTQRSGLKTIGLGLIFLPLALLGTNKMVKITYEKPDEEGAK